MVSTLIMVMQTETDEALIAVGNNSKVGKALAQMGRYLTSSQSCQGDEQGASYFPFFGFLDTFRLLAFHENEATSDDFRRESL